MPFKGERDKRWRTECGAIAPKGKAQLVSQDQEGQEPARRTMSTPPMIT